MHLTVDEPGPAFVTLYIEEPASLSLRTTLPVAKVLPVFEVVLENDENVAKPATLPAAPRIAHVSKSRL
jgi:hypothetical protein